MLLLGTRPLRASPDFLSVLKLTLFPGSIFVREVRVTSTFTDVPVVTNVTA